MNAPADPERMTSHGPRYLGGAVLCALLNNVVLIAGDAAGLHDFVGILLTWLVGGTAGYLWHCRISFRQPMCWAAYVQFMAGIGLAIPLAYGALVLFHRLAGWPMWIAAPAATVALFIYNYLNSRLAILRRRRRASSPAAPIGCEP